MMSNSPFKLLEAYGKEDKDIFFGREEEIEALYQMSFQTNLMLVYGMSGTGKTSLIRCGLANRFEDSDWHDVYIRRNKNLNESFLQELKAHDREASFESEFSVPDMVKSLYLDYLKPIYLIFDQFEELFILGTEQEYRQFIQTISDVLAAELPAKIIIVMREEYLAHLSTFEKVVPSLFDKRLRVEPMTMTNARRVIIDTVRNPKFGIELADESVADTILEHVTEGKGWVQLTYLQVFLDKMWRNAHQQNPDQLVFDHELVRVVGRIEDVLVGFLEEQLEVFCAEIGPKHLALKLLKVFVSDKGTKIPVTFTELRERLPEISEQENLRLLSFFLNNRILRPLDNDQYELTHDSIAYKLFKTKNVGIALPELMPGYGEVPANPFLKFRPYPQEMAAVFHGRSEEIQELFDMVVNKTDIRTTLVFGPLGVGKTSLIQAGLIPRLEQLFKVAKVHFSREFFESAYMQRMLNSEPGFSDKPMLLEAAYRWYRNKPADEERKIIILDQFEELFIWIDDHDQLVHFYSHIQHLLQAEWNVDLVIVVRDEFFAQLQDLEFYLPGILDEQMRIKHIGHEAAKDIIQHTIKNADIKVENEAVIDRIVKTVEEEDGRVNLTYLQLYMDKLYRSIV
jgi:DNA replication protein DnaC